MSKAVILDRDGVINDLVQWEHGLRSPFTLNEFKNYFFKDKFEQAMEYFRAADYLVFVATNQPCVSTGQMLYEDLEEISNYLVSLGVTSVYCAIDPKDKFRYKPYSGMYKEIVRENDLDQTKVWVVGDRWKDMVPGWNCSMQTILCCPENEFYTKLETWPEEWTIAAPGFWASDIAEAAKIIVSEGTETQRLPTNKVTTLFTRFMNG